MACNCTAHCDPLHTGHGWPCICIYIHAEHRCICQCNNNPPFVPHEVTLKTIRSEGTDYADDPDSPVYVHAGLSESASRRRLTLDAEVDLCVKNATVGDVGALLGSLCLADVVIPATRVNERMSISVQRVALERALEQVGLVVLGERSAEAGTASQM
jgi:hypothetical protein